MPTISIDIALFVFYTFAVLFGGYEVRGWKDNSAIYADRDKQDVSVLSQERKNQTVTNGVDYAYQSSLSSVDADYDKLIGSLYAIPSSNLPTVSKSTSGFNAATYCNQLSATDKQTLVKLKAATIQANQLLYLQNWIRAQGMSK